MIKYTDSKGDKITSLLDWEKKIYTGTKKSIHWKKGRSAYSIADYMMNKGGEKKITEMLSSLLGEQIELTKAQPEKEIRFDKYGHGREHDLWIEGNLLSTGKKIFVGIEAKVDETFGSRVIDSYLESKTKVLNGINSKGCERIESLLKSNIKKIKGKHFNLRYQLFYSTVGTTRGSQGEGEDNLYIMLIIVFKTHLYDKAKGAENYKDYLEFVKAVEGVKKVNSLGVDYRELQIDGTRLHSIYIEV